MKELKFIHVTKCAGTYIENIGIEHGYKWGRFHREYGWWHKRFPEVNHTIKRKYDWFCIVRNPYERMLSEYYCQWGGIGTKNIKHTVEEFNKYLKVKIRSEASKIKGHHYTPQFQYIDYNEHIYVIKLEEMKIKLLKLFQKYDINIPITDSKRVNSKGDKNNSCKFTVDDFDNELISLINTVYEKDFLTFGYDMKNKVHFL
jgi:hypothetical protein